MDSKHYLVREYEFFFNKDREEMLVKTSHPVSEASKSSVYGGIKNAEEFKRWFLKNQSTRK